MKTRLILLAALAIAGCKTDDFLASPTGKLAVAAATGAATRAVQSALDQSSGKKIDQKKVALDAAAGALDAVHAVETQPAK